MTKEVQDQLTFDPTTWPGEGPFPPSETVPDMSLTPREILDRYTRTGAFPPGRTPIYNGDTDFPDTSRMTVQEKLDYAKELRDFIKERRQEQKSRVTVEDRIKLLEAQIAGRSGGPREDPPITIVTDDKGQIEISDEHITPVSQHGKKKK